MQIDQPVSFSSFLIGDESLLIRCADILIQNGHDVKGVVTEDAQVTAWAGEQGIRTFSPKEDYLKALRDQPVDYFFSIANLRIVPDEVITLAKKAAINFHDGPLPEYAGLNTPNWSIINQTGFHGITWHLMDGGVDRGDILKQVHFELAPDETAFTLNMKCYEAAIASFADLVDELATGTARPIAQDFANRQYFSLEKRPANACVINWAQGAEQIDALVRALDFGSYTNPMGLPKLLVGDSVFYVPALHVAESSAGVDQGMIFDISPDGLRVATSTRDIIIPEVMSAAGQNVSIAELVQRFGLQEGDILPSLDVEEARRLTAVNERSAKHDKLWAKQLVDLKVLDVPYTRRGDVAAETSYEVRHMDVPGSVATISTALEMDTAKVVATVFAAYMARLTGQTTFDVAFSHVELQDEVAGLEQFFDAQKPLHVEVDPMGSVRAILGSVAGAVEKTAARGPVAVDVHLRYPELRARLTKEGPVHFSTVLAITDGSTYKLPLGAELAFIVHEDGSGCSWAYDSAVYGAESIAAMVSQFEQFVASVAADVDAPFQQTAILGGEERMRLLYGWNETEKSIPIGTCIHQLFEAQARAQPEAIAAAFEYDEITYAELNARSNQLASYLRNLGVGPDQLVGVHIDRSIDLLTALLAVLKAGGAYVPLDPAFPKDRLALMIEDAELAVLLTQERLLNGLPDNEAQIVCVDRDRTEIAKESAENVESGVRPEHLAYVIYTSGSTGRPKGVMVEHRNVVNFFEGMDERIEHDRGGVWLAVTSISFDISVLELFWTLARGFKVVIQGSDKRALATNGHAVYEHADKKVDFSLFYFASDEGGESAQDKYQLLLEGARFADEHGFDAVWTPERHFHAFGGLYPNPSVASAAIAAVTKNVKIRAGSVVSPLHSPIRIAEEWSVVDNISQGRVGISFAAGWQPNDFVLMPENFKDRKDLMFRQIDEVQALWQGKSVAFKGPKGDMVEVRTLPRPVQSSLPVWVTAAGNPETFEMAGAKGYRLLTHLLGQSVEELAEKIAIYRKAWKDAGHAGEGHITLMLHTFVGSSVDEVREIVREPMKEYLRSSVSLIQAAAWSFPAFKQKTTDSEGRFSISQLSPEELDGVLDFSFERYFETSGLFGCQESCLRMVDRLKGIGVNEIACLIDFGVPAKDVLAQLPALNEVRARANEAAAVSTSSDDYTITAQIRRHGVTHFQCTPSQASMLVAEEAAYEALRSLKQFMVGGEALPLALAEKLTGLDGVRIENMYGPTETTIWSTTHTVGQEQGGIPIGRPIANTQIYILDEQYQPVPVGLPGELYIGGLGVARGYLRRDKLTAERFVADPFVPGNRMYRTGDLARYRADGTIEFLGRNDFQVKLRGYRIELGEIETLLGQYPAVQDAVVIVREDEPNDKRLVGYVRFYAGRSAEPVELRAHLSESLPDYMVPADFVVMEVFPLTPNGKVDRKQLPAPQRVRVSTERMYVAPGEGLEKTIAEVWREALKVDQISTSDNFFDLGGHSLLAVQVNEKLRSILNREIAIVDLFRYPTVSMLAKHLGQESESSASAEEGMSRGAARREMMLRRQRLGV